MIAELCFDPVGLHPKVQGELEGQSGGGVLGDVPGDLDDSCLEQHAVGGRDVVVLDPQSLEHGVYLLE